MKISKTLLALTITYFILQSQSFAMGGDKPGPNGGHITMPGAYHVELVDQKDQIALYLLDISIKNPTIINSSVTLKLIPKNKSQITQELKCVANKVAFTCAKNNLKLSDYTEIKVESIRNKQKGITANYPLPLKYQ